MSKEFDFIDLYYLNDISTPANQAPEFSFIEGAEIKEKGNYIEISGSEVEDPVAYTYSKFLEILDTQGLEGLVRS